MGTAQRSKFYNSWSQTHAVMMFEICSVFTTMEDKHSVKIPVSSHIYSFKDSATAVHGDTHQYLSEGLGVSCPPLASPFPDIYST